MTQTTTGSKEVVCVLINFLSSLIYKTSMFAVERCSKMIEEPKQCCVEHSGVVDAKFNEFGLEDPDPAINHTVGLGLRQMPTSSRQFCRQSADNLPTTPTSSRQIADNADFRSANPRSSDLSAAVINRITTHDG